jgi:FixJ family two-component response regulator
MNGETVFLVDDDAGVLRALSRLFRVSGFEVRAFQSGAEFLRQHESDTPGCAVLDLSLNDCTGLELQRAISADSYRRPTVFITGHGDVQASVQAMKGGAVDFLTKPVDDTVLLDAVRAAVERDKALRRERQGQDAAAARMASLTPRERQVLDCVVTGRLNKQIAGDLGIGEKTVKVHRARVMAKMGVRSVADLVRLAQRALGTMTTQRLQ